MSVQALGDVILIYAVTSLVFALPLPVLWYFRSLTALRIVILLFAADTAVTIEAAYYSDVVLIAVLHVVTVPAFFGLLYFDLLRQTRKHFKCFLCSNPIAIGENSQLTRNLIGGEQIKVEVHTNCISETGKNPISERVFRKGIPT